VIFRSPSTREIARIAIPVSLEFMVMLTMNFVNQVIVGGLGSVAIAGVGFAGSIGFIVLVTGGSLGASVAVLGARAFGGNRQTELNSTVSVALLLAAVVSAPIGIAFALWPTQIMTAVGGSPGVVEQGAAYLAFFGLAIAPGVLGTVLSGLMRSTGYPKLPMYITIASVFLDSLLAWLLVYGFGPLPALGVSGAGIAILVANLFKMFALLWFAFVRVRLVSWHIPVSRAVLVPLIGSLFYLAIPMALAEIFWTSGIFLYNVIYQQIGDEELAAGQIVATLEAVFIMGSIGLMAAGQALIGRAVGRGDGPEAQLWVRRVTRAGVITGILFGILYAASIVLVQFLFPDVEDYVIHLAVLGILINASIQTIKVQNMILGAGVLPSGNDVKGVLLTDVIGAFVVGLPLAWLLGLHTPLLFFGVLIARIAEEAVKLAILTWRKNRINWNALAAQHAASPEQV